jgi:hypothetical protein
MKVQGALAVAAIIVGVVLVLAMWSPSSVPPAPRVVEPGPNTSAEVAALSGVWEGLGPDALPIRLVVEEVRDRWATVVYTWGDHPAGKFHRGWLRVRAVVFPGGKLFWRHPGEFVFHLSDDWTTLVGSREQAGRTATSLMRRVSAGTLLSALPTEDGP